MSSTYYNTELTGQLQKFSKGKAQAVSHLVMAGYNKGWKTISLDYIKDTLHFHTTTEVHSILQAILHMKSNGVLRYKREGKFQKRGVYLYSR